MRKIGILISEEGKIEIKTEGFQGDACIKEADELLRKLREFGVEVETQEIKKTQEFYAVNEQKLKTGNV